MGPSLGQIAYEAYCENRNWKSFNGDPLPRWEDQKEELKEAWHAAADAVRRDTEYRIRN